MSNHKNNKKVKVNKELEVLSYEQSYESNLPSPKDMKDYEMALPGMAEKILKMTQKEQDFRHKNTPRLMFLTFAGELMRIFFSGVLAIGGLLLSYSLIKGGQGIEGVVLFLGEITLLVGTFIYSKKSIENNSSKD